MLSTAITLMRLRYWNSTACRHELQWPNVDQTPPFQYYNHMGDCSVKNRLYGMPAGTNLYTYYIYIYSYIYIQVHHFGIYIANILLSLLPLLYIAAYIAVLICCYAEGCVVGVYQCHHWRLVNKGQCKHHVTRYV